MEARPAGIVTFLFTDVAGSTRLWERHPTEMSNALERHDGLCRTWFDRCAGYVFATGGDGFAVAFARTSDAVTAASGLQRDLVREPWPSATPLAVRMALHTGETVERNGDYFGPTVNAAARLLAVGHGGQILMTDATRQLLGDEHDLRDLGAHSLRDLATPMRIWQLGREDFGPLRTVDAHGNLPSARSPLVGRVEELANVTSAMSSHRLVTLTGVGGVGKTRLALAAASELAAAHADGCWFVDLSARETSDDLAAVVSLALGADATATEPQLLLEHLRERRSVIVLDNCEHLVDRVAELAEDILRATTDVRLLATSREPLGIDGEHVHRVRSLALPEVGDDDEAVTRSPAVALFVDRAREAGASPNIAGESATIAAICRHLDGIPLAIELAAARTRAMSAAEILARIGERFRLLGGGRRSLERHRTLMATVRWSHDLLRSDEQIVWRRLAVFAGGFDIEAAEAVVGRPDTIEALLSLVDKSMVQADTTNERTRYWMLETLRQFAAERLADAGEVDVLRGRHADHYLSRVGADGIPLRGPDEHLAWQVITPDRDNLVVAAERLLTSGRDAELVETMTAAPSFWIVIAPADGLRLLELAAANAGDEVASRALSLGAFLAWEAGDPEEAIRLGRAHLAACSRVGRPPAGWGLAALLITGNFAPPTDVDDLVEAALTAAELDEDDFLGAIVHATIAGHRHRRGDAGWRASFEHADRAAARLDSSSALITVAVSRAAEDLRSINDAPDMAIAALQTVENRIPTAPSTPGAWYHLVAGRAYFDQDRDRAVDHLHEAIRVGDQLGSGIVSHIAYEGVALAFALDGRLGEAAILRAVTGRFFDAAGRHRAEIAEAFRSRLDTILDADASSADIAAAAARAEALSRHALLELALGDVEPHAGSA